MSHMSTLFLICQNISYFWMTTGQVCCRTSVNHDLNVPDGLLFKLVFLWLYWIMYLRYRQSFNITLEYKWSQVYNKPQISRILNVQETRMKGQIENMIKSLTRCCSFSTRQYDKSQVNLNLQISIKVKAVHLKGFGLFVLRIVYYRSCIWMNGLHTARHWFSHACWDGVWAQ